LLYRTEFGADNASSFSIGAVMREADDESIVELKDEFSALTSTGKYEVPLAPSSIAVSTAIEFPLGKSGQMVFAVQYETLDYGTVSDDFVYLPGDKVFDSESINNQAAQVGNYLENQDSEWERASAGIEYSYLTNSNLQFSLRAGYWQGEDSNYADRRLEFNKANSMTFGASIFHPKLGKIEVSYEDRTIDNNELINYEASNINSDFRSYEVKLMSVAYTYAWM